MSTLDFNDTISAVVARTVAVKYPMFELVEVACLFKNSATDGLKISLKSNDISISRRCSLLHVKSCCFEILFNFEFDIMPV